MHHEVWLYVIFAVILAASMAFDFYQHKKDKAVSIKSALWETLFWVCVAVVFGGIIFLFEGKGSTIDYFSGYLLEKSLSVDNLFVMIAIFSSFAIPEKYRHRVLYYGILGAIILRLLFISLGSALLSLGEWVLIVFGVIVLITAIKMLIDQMKGKSEEEIMDYSHGKFAQFAKKFMPVAPDLDGHNFFTKIDGKWHMTVLFLALIVIEFSDVIFAFDSLPAILSITQDIFIVFASNIFAILGLRALYFVLEAVGNKWHYVNYAVIGILFYIGIKMIIGIFWFHLNSLVNLAVIIGFLAIGVGLSIWESNKRKRRKQQTS